MGTPDVVNSLHVFVQKGILRAKYKTIIKVIQTYYKLVPCMFKKSM